MKYLRFFPILIFVFLSLPSVSFSQYDYRTKASGNWDDASTWQYDTDGEWIDASTPPPSDANSILIQSGHIITVRSNLGITRTSIQGQVTINPGVTLTVASEGGDPDLALESTGTLRIKGTLVVDGGITVGWGSTIIYNGSTAQTIVALDYYNLQIDNPAGVDLPNPPPAYSIRKGGTKSLAFISNVTVEGTLTVANGDFRTGSHTLELGEYASISEAAPYSVVGELYSTRRCTTDVVQNFGGMGIEINAGAVGGYKAPKSTATTSMSSSFTVDIMRSTGSAPTDTNKTLIKRKFYLYTDGVAEDVALVFHYATNELNGISESNLRLYESDDGSSWSASEGTLNVGAHTITVTGIDFHESWWTGGQPAGLPTLTSISPSSSQRGTTLSVTLTGTQFVNGSTTVSFGSGISVNSTTVNSSTQITASITIAAGASTGFRDVSVTNSVGTATLPNAFEVQLPPNPTPTLFIATPATGNRGQSLPVTLQGTGFVSGITTVSFGAGITVNSVSVTNGASLTAQITVSASAALGARTVSVTNPPAGGGTASRSNIFNVTNPVPTLSSISPTTGGRTQTLDVTLIGTNFVSDTSKASFGDGVTVVSTTYGSPTSIGARITITSAATLGARDVTVTNAGPGGGSIVLASAFTIVNPLPTITNVVPDSGGSGQTVNVTVNGTGFVPGVTTLSFGSDIAVSLVNVLSGTQLTAQLAIAPSTANGSRIVTVTNAAPGGGSASRVSGFRIVNPVPTISSVSPISGISGQTVTLTINGSNFILGQTTVGLGTGFTTNSVTVSSPTQLSATILISPSAAGGPRTVTVTNLPPGGGSATLTNGFMVNNPVPTLTSLGTSSGFRGTTIGLYANGSGFITGVTSISFGAGITVNSVSVSTPAQMYVSITVAPDAAFGSRDVIVTNAAPGGGTAKLTAYFDVMNPFPSLTTLSPNSGALGQSLSVAMTGTGFVNGVSRVAFGDGITVNSASSNPAGTLITAAITISPSAVVGTRNVSVSNPAPGGGTATLNAGFSIISPAPTISGIAPATVIRGQTISVTVTGTNFISGTTTLSLGTGITINSSVVNSPTQFVANITVGADASTGARNVVVTNAPPGGGSATLTGGLTVENPAPTLTNISPIVAARGDVLDVSLTGTNFIAGVTTASFGDGIAVNAVAVSSLTRATASVSVGIGAALGLRNVSVTNPTPGGGTSALTNAFTVGNPVPTLTSISPSAGKRGQTLSLILTGTGFISGSTSLNLGANILVNSLVVNSATQMTANVTIAAEAAAGARAVSVTNVAPGGGTATLSGGLTVENPVPALSSIAPVSGVRGTTNSVTLTGSNFISGLSQVSFGPDIQVNSVVVSSPTQIVVGITIALGASTGARDVVVTHAAPGGGTATLSGAFSVTNPAPTVASVAPVTAGRGSVLNVTVTGSQFISGVTSLSFGADVTVSNLLVKSPTELQASITISFSAAVGPRAVTITNAVPGGGSASLPNGFNVTTSPATEVQLDPNGLPHEYVLQEAYPNPFNPSTRIAYSLPENSRIRLDVHNMLGNIVAELAVGERAKGLYEMQWHADNLPSGVYLIRMHAESLESTKRFIASRKVVLVK